VSSTPSEDAAPPEQPATEPAPEPPAETSGRLLAPTASAAVVLGAIGVLAALSSKRAQPPLARGETVLFETRPRRGFWRYLTSFGLYELNRRTTYFAVTNKRVLIDRGLLQRRTRSIPVKGIADVNVVCGPLEGLVEIAEAGGTAGSSQEIGPLKARAARAFAAALERAGSR
jgi:hypothetical protein